jgi:hypothetical protein
MCPRDDFPYSIIDARGVIKDRNSHFTCCAVWNGERIIHDAVGAKASAIGELSCRKTSIMTLAFAKIYFTARA